MEQVYATAAFTLWGILLFVFVIGIIINKKKLKDTPQDDSNWNTDYDELKNALRKFVSNKNEEVVAILGKVSAIKLLNSNINNVGFCILSDKAFYFVGRVYQRKGIFSFRSNIQHRIPITEMRGIKVGTIHRFEMFLFGIISAFVIIGEIKIIADLLAYADEIGEDVVVAVAAIGSLLVIPIALVMMVYYIAQALLVKRTTVCIELNGLTVNFLVCELGIQEIKDFYRDVSKMQNDRISVPQNDRISVLQSEHVSQVNIGSEKVSKLTELSHLYEQGMLQQEEFERLKSEIINN